MSRRRLLVLVSTIVTLFLIVTAVGALAWLEHYAPLSYDGGGFTSSAHQIRHVAAYVGADPASGGTDVVYPRFRAGHDYFVGFTIWNAGPLDVTLLGIDTAHAPLGPVAMYARDLRGEARPELDEEWGGQVRLDRSVPLSHLAIRGHSGRFIWIGFRMRSCRGYPDAGTAEVHRTVTLRFRYFRIFTRTQHVRLPIAVALLCHGPIPPSTPILGGNGNPSRSSPARPAAERADRLQARPDPGLRRARPRL